MRLQSSIALATYNGEKYIAQQLDSFARQTRLPDELVVSDDHSTDGTLDIIASFASTAPFAVKVVVNEGPRGFNRNFENAVRQCQYDVILFSDQDDVWFREHVARLSSPFEEDTSLTIVISNSQWWMTRRSLSTIQPWRPTGFPLLCYVERTLREESNSSSTCGTGCLWGMAWLFDLFSCPT
ncbi:glycosyltransferase [Granulicella tundricola]|uniref:glycosyltransferase n=1 Tax=Granulicella tundricola TaxID=940615 RepID=UPI0001DB7992|nr:glycosyltransferase [Granulicella tundricola]